MSQLTHTKNQAGQPDSLRLSNSSVLTVYKIRFVFERQLVYPDGFRPIRTPRDAAESVPDRRF
jgi:hypothetical protein